LLCHIQTARQALDSINPRSTALVEGGACFVISYPDSKASLGLHKSKINHSASLCASYADYGQCDDPEMGTVRLNGSRACRGAHAEALFNSRSLCRGDGEGGSLILRALTLHHDRFALASPVNEQPNEPIKASNARARYNVGGHLDM